MFCEINWQVEQNCVNTVFKLINVTAGVEGNINAKKADMSNKAGEQVKLVIGA